MRGAEHGATVRAFLLKHPMSAQFVPVDWPQASPPLTIAVHSEGDTVVSRTLRDSGAWEPFESALIWDSLGCGDVFLDVGANLGYFSLLAAQKVGQSGCVYAFEPDPSNAELLMRSAVRNGLVEQIQLQQAALAEHEGEGRLHLSADNFGDHQLFPADASRQSVPIALVQGDTFFVDVAALPNLVKVDTQGSEYHVILGLMSTLHRLQAPRLLIELTPFSLREAGVSGRMFIELLAQLGLMFWIVDHIEHRLVPSTEAELALWCDNVDAVQGDQGFMNIFLGAPPGNWQQQGANYHPPHA